MMGPPPGAGNPLVTLVLPPPPTIKELMLLLLEELKREYEGEALFRISNIARWMGCPGSVQLIAKVPKTARGFASSYNEGGTAAHKVSELAIKGTHQPEDWLDRKIVVDEETGRTVEVDEEMVSHTTRYVELVVEAAAPEGTELHTEVALSLGHLDPDDPILAECRGTGDAVMLNAREGWVEVGDLKYGMGIPVPATSKQPKGYALLAMIQFEKLGVAWKKASTWIFQPRGRDADNPVKRMEYAPEELYGTFLGEVIDAMHTALAPNPPLRPEIKPLAHHSYCHYCPAGRADICPARRDLTLKMGGDNFDRITSLFASSPLPSMPAEVTVAPPGEHKAVVKLSRDGVHVLRSAFDLDPGEISEVLDQASLVKSQLENWIATVQHRAFQLISAGTKVPNYYIKPRTKRRVWKGARDEIALKIHNMTGLPMTEIYKEESLKSPHQIEERLPAAKKKLIEDLYETPIGEDVLMKGEPDPDYPQKLLLTPLTD